MDSEIIQELRKFENYQDKQKIKSFVIFNISSKESLDIQVLLKTEFEKLHKTFETLREQELSQKLKKLDWISEKYSKLAQRYEGKPVLGEIYEWENDVHKHEYDMIVSTETELKSLTENFCLEVYDFNEFKINEVRFNQLNDTMDFSNLMRCDFDDNYAKYYKLNDKELEYRDLQDYFSKKRFPKYLFCHNEAYQNEFDNLFKSSFKWDRLKWSVFTFSFSQDQFERSANDFVIQEMYYNRKIINNAP